ALRLAELGEGPVLVEADIDDGAGFEERPEDQHVEGRVLARQLDDGGAFLRGLLGDTVAILAKGKRLLTPAEPPVRVIGDGGDVRGQTPDGLGHSGHLYASERRGSFATRGGGIQSGRGRDFAQAVAMASTVISWASVKAMLARR